ncbi:hypothetical protein BCR33DRAFT_855708 [Rhizoclosmatium globosum]|uniref:Uncharacterized protein n=1 Tax=Rhizoclosmatium globosum TaxID=329046 RepID=A0A1Y2BKD7_9FUNG|nr:hypothetical protein BCR33DRAFT_855708 [Rhizoclosmatium globosum]|eukprot:ORY35234.1 hypothetical protein BCR33DRAFT_855708 [Rhizoclosmatium globosum]
MRLWLLPILLSNTVTLIRALSLMDLPICFDSRTYGKYDIVKQTPLFGTDFFKDGWQLTWRQDTGNAANMSDLISVDPSSVSVNKFPYFSDKGTVDMTYSCINNVGPEQIVLASRTMFIPEELFGASDEGILAFDFFLSNQLVSLDVLRFLETNASSDEPTPTLQIHYVNFTFLDSTHNIQGYHYETDLQASSSGYGVSNKTVKLPQYTRHIRMEVQGNGTELNGASFCLGRYAIFVYPIQVANRQFFQNLVNFTFLVALALIPIIPTAMILESQWFGHRTLKMLDLVHTQGSRLIRAMFYSLCCSFLYITYQWLTSSSTSAYRVLPLFSGLDSDPLKNTSTSKMFRTPVFMLCFLVIGALFWPIAICYGHVNEGSRGAAGLGFLATLNMGVLRFGIQYLQMDPLESVAYSILYHGFELIAYIAIITYFAINIMEPARWENRIRKTHFKDVVHVVALLRHIKDEHMEDGNDGSESMRIMTRIKKYFRLDEKDARPIWLRGRRKKFRKVSVALTTLECLRKAPVRLVAVIFMIVLFTYMEFVVFLATIFNSTPQISCTLGLLSASIAQLFDTTDNISFFGKSITVLKDLQKLGNPVDLFQRMTQGSSIFACFLTALILGFNIIDLSVTFQRDLGRLRVGEYGFMSDGERKQVSSAMASQFMGIQVGFAFIGSLYTLFFMQVLCFFLSCFFVSSYLREVLVNLVTQNGVLIIAAVVSFLLTIVQSLIINRFYVSHYDASIPETAETIKVSTKFWLKDLNKYNQIDYVFLFPNLITGLLTFLASILTGLLGSAIFSYRIDKRSVIPSLSKTPVYLSWVIQEHHHNNPVVLVAVKLFREMTLPDHLSPLKTFTAVHGRIQEEVREKKREKEETMYSLAVSLSLRSMEEELDSLEDGKDGKECECEGEGVKSMDTLAEVVDCKRGNIRARIRWFLAYTLIKNPGLVGYRKQRVQETLLALWVYEHEAVTVRRELMRGFEGGFEKEVKEAKESMRRMEVDLWRCERLVGKRKGGEGSGSLTIRSNKG